MNPKEIEQQAAQFDHEYDQYKDSLAEAQYEQ